MSHVMPIVDVDPLDGRRHEAGLYDEVDSREVGEEQLIEDDQHENEDEEEEFIEDDDDIEPLRL